MTELLQPGRPFFLVGICGAGMSSLAMLLHSIGMDVRGSDIANDGLEAERLTSLGIRVMSEAEALVHFVVTKFWCGHRQFARTMWCSSLQRESERLFSTEQMSCLPSHPSIS